MIQEQPYNMSFVEGLFFLTQLSLLYLLLKKLWGIHRISMKHITS